MAVLVSGSIFMKEAYRLLKFELGTSLNKLYKIYQKFLLWQNFKITFKIYGVKSSLAYYHFKGA